MSQYFTCDCGNELDATDWIDYWANNDDTFAVTCDQCEESSEVRVSITVEYEDISNLH